MRDLAAFSEAEADAEARALREAIRHHDRLYYVEAKPAVADAVYDRLFARLEAIEARWPDLRAPDSPTLRVAGGVLEGLGTAEHAAPMLSLLAVQDRAAVERFDRAVRRHVPQPVYVVEPKYDGLSLELVYEDGVFARAATRGDGRRGDDVTHALRTVRNLPLRLAPGAPRTLSLRAEVYLPLDSFHEVNRRRLEAGLEPYANPRNTAAGAVRQFDVGSTARLPLRVVVYDVLAASPDLAPAASHWDLLGRLAAWHLPVGDRNARAAGLEDVFAYHAKLGAQRDRLPYEVDGVVVKLDDLAARGKLGSRDRNPRWALAWKFAPRAEVTRLHEIVVVVGRTGKLTPVAFLDPVDVGGVTVSRANLHNEAQVRRLGLRPGDRVRVERAGDVIPQVTQRVAADAGAATAADAPAPGAAFTMPARCPACGAPVEREGANHFCPAGLACPAQAMGRIVHYAGREGLDIRGLGPQTVLALWEAGLARDVADLYLLREEDVASLERMGPVSARNLVAGIQATKRPDLDRFLVALAIRHLGGGVAKRLASHVGTWAALRGASPEGLAAAPGIGPTTAGAVHAFLHDARNADVLRRLEEAGVRPRPARPPPAATGPLVGRTFVFTGRLEGMTRAEAGQAVAARGAGVADSLTAAVTDLVAGEAPGSKLAAARRRGVRVLDAAAFRRLLDEA